MFEIIVIKYGEWLYTVENITWEVAQEIADEARLMGRKYKIAKMERRKENDLETTT